MKITYKNNKGVTIVSLVITIIILLILSAITLTLFSSDNGLISKAKIAKENTEINDEEEVLRIAAIKTMEKNIYGEIDKEELQQELEKNIGKDKAELEQDNNIFIVYIKDVERYYEIDADGDVKQYKPYVDSTPGELDGKGTKENPFKIESIEDLIAFSQKVNSGSTRYTNKYVVLCRTLDFESKKSYCDSSSIYYSDYLEAEQGTALINALTDKNLKGFRMIGDNSKALFCGIFDGQGYGIKNIYIKRSKASLFGNVDNATIKNLLISGEIIGEDSVASGFALSVNNSSFYNCYNEANIVGTTVGGICANVKGNIIVRNCYNKGIISGKWQSGASGIIAYSYDDNSNIDIKNSYNLGDVTLENGTSYAAAGGIFGGIKGTLKIANCYNVSKNKSSVYSGAIVGASSMSKTTLENCYFLNNMNKAIGNGEITGYLMCEENYMKSNDIINKLNSYVELYNSNDDGEEKFIKLLMWKQEGKNNYPTFLIN